MFWKKEVAALAVDGSVYFVLKFHRKIRIPLLHYIMFLFSMYDSRYDVVFLPRIKRCFKINSRKAYNIADGVTLLRETGCTRYYM